MNEETGDVGWGWRRAQVTGIHLTHSIGIHFNYLINYYELIVIKKQLFIEQTSL